jgi:hypothetical protein
LVESGKGGAGIGIGGEWGRTGECFVEDDAEGVEVGPAIDRGALDLLGGQVLGGTHHRAVAGEVGALRRFGDAEVGDQNPTVARQQDVGRLDVAVDEAAGVGGTEGIGHLGADGEYGVELEGPVLVEVGPHGGADHQLHDDGVDAVLGEGVVDRDDGGVGQPGGGDGLAPESLDEGMVAGQVRVEDLDGDLAGQHLVGGPPDLGHTARRDRVVQPVPTGQDPSGPKFTGRRGSGAGRRGHDATNLVRAPLSAETGQAVSTGPGRARVGPAGAGWDRSGGGVPGEADDPGTAVGADHRTDGPELDVVSVVALGDEVEKLVHVVGVP